MKKKKEEKEIIEKEKQLRMLEKDLKEEVGKSIQMSDKNDEGDNNEMASNYPKISMYAKEEDEENRIEYDNDLEEGKIQNCRRSLFCFYNFKLLIKF